MTFPQTPLPTKVELSLSGSWTDITTDVYARDGITITRGRADEQQQIGPGSCQLTLDNRTGKYSPRNPTGTYYGMLGRNTPLRVSWPAEPVYDASSVSSATTGNMSWTHTPTSTRPSAVIVWVGQTGNTASQITSVTYGGVDMTALGATITNPGGRLYRYMLTTADQIPAGPQTVLVTVSGAASKRSVATTISGGNVATVTTATGSGSGANPSVNISPTGRSLLLAHVHSGQDAISGIAPATGYSDVQETDFGVDVWSVIRKFAGAIDAGTHAVGWVATADTWTAEVLAVEVRTYRFYGEVSEWPPRWDVTGNDAYVQITASGITRRLGQGDAFSASPLRTTILSNFPGLYFPLDEGPLAGYGRSYGNVASSLLRFTKMPLSLAGDFKFGEGDLGEFLPKGFSVGTTTTGYISTRAAHVPGLSTMALDYVYRADSLGELDVRFDDYNLNRWYLIWDPDFFEVTVGLQIYWPSETSAFITLATLSVTEPFTDNLTHHVRLMLVPNGLNVDWTFYIDGDVIGSGTRNSIQTNGCKEVSMVYHPLGAQTDMALGHVTIWNDDFLPDVNEIVTAMNANAGELVGDRIVRLCAESEVSISVRGAEEDPEAMGPQPTANLLDSLRQCTDVVGSTIYESRDNLGLTYRPVADVVNQTPRATIDYSAHELQPPLEPTDDDQLTRNDVTLTRDGGGSVNAVETEGPLSVEDPPDGVGRYTSNDAANVFSDDQLPDLAYWRLRQGTHDESRYPLVSVNRAAPAVVANTTLGNALLEVDVDDRIKITNADAINLYDDVSLIVRGYTERISQFEHSLQFNCSPEGPMQVAVYDAVDADEGGNRYSPDDTWLLEAINSSATSFRVGVPTGPIWTHDDGDFDILMGGERMTVTAVSTDTISFVGIGAKASGNNVSLNPGLPAGVASGDQVLIYASIRNSGTGTVNTPANWTSIVQFGNCSLLGRVYDGVWTMPTVTFTGGAAGEDTIAQSAAFRGITMIDAATSSILNGSAQNITTPGIGTANGMARVVLWMGWKQDDWTSVAVLNHTGAIEIEEASSGAGNDAAQIWDYKIVIDQAEDCPARTFTVTGGAAAISRGGLVTFPAGQTITVTRSVNSVSKSHAAGEHFELFEPAYYAL